MQRRTLVLAGAVLPWSAASWAEGKKNREISDPALEQGLRRVERRVGGRLGVAVLDTQTGRQAAHRGDERFALCSTFKLLLAARTLRRAEQGQEQLTQRVAYTQADLLPYSPVTGPRLQQGGAMSVAELCEPAAIWSDNAAANLLLARQGGPAGLTAWLRSLGDARTRLDRQEPELNQVAAGDERDTTTPRAMLRTLQTLVLGGEALSPASRERLQAWMLDNRTGDRRLRAGMPVGWRIGEKTGSGRSTTNDIGVIWPVGRGPVVLACYLTDCPAASERRDAALAEVGALVAAWVRG